MYHAIDYRTLSFSGPESFPLRFAWLKKGFEPSALCSGLEATGTGAGLVSSCLNAFTGPFGDSLAIDLPFIIFKGKWQDQAVPSFLHMAPS